MTNPKKEKKNIGAADKNKSMSIHQYPLDSEPEGNEMLSPLRWWQDPRITKTKKRGQSLSGEKVAGGEGCAAVARLLCLASPALLPPPPRSIRVHNMET
jgi:hypothetical protein